MVKAILFVAVSGLTLAVFFLGISRLPGGLAASMTSPLRFELYIGDPAKRTSMPPKQPSSFQDQFQANATGG